MEQKRKLFTFQLPGDDQERPFPPHLKAIPKGAQTATVFGPGAIFDAIPFASTAILMEVMMPEKILDFFYDFKKGQNSFKDIEEAYRSGQGDGFLRKASMDTIGNRDDWYRDDVFAQQAFTGTNPTTIRNASAERIEDFKTAAKEQSKHEMLKILDQVKENFFILDCNYFREAAGLGEEDLMSCTDELYGNKNDPNPSLQLFLPAAVTLFHLGEEGRLHPLAIIIDFKGSVEKSVTIFNQRLTFDSPTDTEAQDWPWRYAKLCSQVSDWVRHELTIHLTNTHLVEEAIIVAANRTLEPEHPVFRILRPHWDKTLSLNAAARSTLVPSIIEKLVGIPSDRVYRFINHAYKNFHFTNLYVPTDLALRGFDPAAIHPSTGRFHNYGYGYNINLMWHAIRRFVHGKLTSTGLTSAAVASDPQIRAWTAEMHSPYGADMPSFPTITTLDALVDAVTMCIHIASPQHTAVNYLQEYYQSFVANKPPALCSPIPTSLAKLQAFTEQDVIDALPVSRPKSWLLASHIPHLLSPHVVSHDSLLTLALSYREFADQHVKGYETRIERSRKVVGGLMSGDAGAGDSAGEADNGALQKEEEAKQEDFQEQMEREMKLRDAAETFYKDLRTMSRLSKAFGKGMDDAEVNYDVLQPSRVADSIEI